MKDLTDSTDRLGADATETLVWQRTTYRTILTTAQTGGKYAVLDSTSPPNWGPPRHIHQAEDEIFIVLDGEVEFWLEGRTFVKGPGETAFIPRGAEHAFRGLGTRPNRHLVILTPGGFEGFFAEMAAHQYRIPQDMSAVAQIAARHNMVFTGPPLGEA